jgi:hypothetical protein
LQSSACSGTLLRARARFFVPVGSTFGQGALRCLQSCSRL